MGQVWINEFCSVVTIDKFNPSTGELSGTHHNMGWVAEGYFVFTGYKNLIGNTIGWTLVFQNDEENVCRVASWAGQIQCINGAAICLPSGTPVIMTTWLLTRQTPYQYDWSSNDVGIDVFVPIGQAPAKCVY